MTFRDTPSTPHTTGDGCPAPRLRRAPKGPIPSLLVWPLHKPFPDCGVVAGLGAPLAQARVGRAQDSHVRQRLELPPAHRVHERLVRDYLRLRDDGGVRQQRLRHAVERHKAARQRIVAKTTSQGNVEVSSITACPAGDESITTCPSGDEELASLNRALFALDLKNRKMVTFDFPASEIKKNMT